MKISAAITLLLMSIALSITSIQNNSAQSSLVPAAKPSTAPVRPPLAPAQAPIEKVQEKGDSIEREFWEKTQKRDKLLDQLINKTERLENENAILKKRLKIGAMTNAQTVNAQKKNSIVTVRNIVSTAAADTVFITNTEYVPCPDTLLVPVKRRSLFNRIFN